MLTKIFGFHWAQYFNSFYLETLEVDSVEQTLVVNCIIPPKSRIFIKPPPFNISIKPIFHEVGKDTKSLN